MNRALLLALSLLIPACDGGASTPGGEEGSGTDPLVHVDPVGVVAILDGDTILVARGGSSFKVRLRGVDTPELNSDSEQPPEAFAQDARTFTLQSAGLEVGLEYDLACEPDPAPPCLDTFGRSLAYVRLSSGADLGQELVRLGLARLMVFEDQPFDRRDDYIASQTEAQLSALGIWSE